MMMKSVLCVAVASLLVTAGFGGFGGVSHAEPGSPVAGSPAVLLPHADPRPIPDIDSYHVVTDTKQYEVHDKTGRLLGMQFSTPDGALCGLNVDVDLAPRKYDFWNFGSSSCVSDKFPQVHKFDPRFDVPNGGRAIVERVYIDNIDGFKGYLITPEIVLHYFAPDPTPSERKQVDDWKRLRGVLAAADAGHLPEGFPVLPAGNILSFTPNNDPNIIRHKATPLPLTCAVGFNHVVWCASHTLIEVQYNRINTTSTAIPKDKLKPKGFYVSPEKAVLYDGYNDPGEVQATN